MDTSILPPNDGGAIDNQSDEYIGKHQFLRRKDARNAALLKLGHEAVVMDKYMRQNKIVENTVKGLQEQAGYNTGSDGQSTGEEEDMGVSIGNETRTETHYHYPEQQTSKPNNLLPAAVLAAGLATGAGLYFSRQPDTIIPPAQQVIVEPSKSPLIDTDIGVGFDEPQQIENIQLVPLQRKQEPEAEKTE